MPVFELNIDGHPARATIAAAELDAIHLPLLRHWAERWRQGRGRFIVFLAGPSGAGKTVLAALWEQLARAPCTHGRGRIGVPVQSLPMDGFHYPNQVLDAQTVVIDGVEMPLRQIKGRPETFDLPALRRAVAAVRSGKAVQWPRYDRTRHDPVPDAIPVLPEGILVVEGLYMLLDLPGWDQLRAAADHGVFLECPQDVLRADLITRKERQGQPHADAAAHYELVDHYIWQITTRRRHGADTVIRVGPDRRLALLRAD